MPQHTSNHRRRPLFYGWIIVAVCALSLLVVFGVRLSFSVFFVALIDDYGWSRADTSLIFAITMGVFGLSSVAVGLAQDRWGARLSFTVGALLLVVGLLLSSFIETLNQLIWSYGVICGLGITVLGLGPQARLISSWFQRKRGLALGIAFAGTGIGSLLLTPAAQWMVMFAGWRNAYRLLALLCAALIPLFLLVLRDEPLTMGLTKDGLPPHTPKTDSAETISPRTVWTLKTAARTPAFWLILLATLGAIGPVRLLTVHQIAAMVDVGISPSTAAAVVGRTGLVAALTFVLFGGVSDRLGRAGAYTLGSICLLGALTIIGALLTPQASLWLTLYPILLGMGEGSRVSLILAVAGDRFPGKGLGAINGAIGAASAIGAGLFSWLGGLIFDALGSYTVALFIAAVAAILSTLALWLATRTTRVYHSQTNSQINYSQVNQ